MGKTGRNAVSAEEKVQARLGESRSLPEVLNNKLLLKFLCEMMQSDANLSSNLKLQFDP